MHIHHVYYTRLTFQVNTQQQTAKYLQICEEEMVAISVFDCVHACIRFLFVFYRASPPC